MVQRLLCSSGEALLWGEPYAEAQIIQSLTNSARILLKQGGWPKPFFPTRNLPEDQHSMFFDHLGSRWIANLYPDPSALRDSYRVMLDRLFRQPAEELGFKRFGMKVVRLQIEHAFFLKWLYPDARFVFLIRDPWRCWSSYRGCRWVYAWPNLYIDKPAAFGKIWQRNTNNFLKWEEPSLMIIRYEELLQNPQKIEELRVHCELDEIDTAVLQRRLRGIDPPLGPMTKKEASVISSVCGDLAQNLGYTAPLL